jgi:hypothetical protein
MSFHFRRTLVLIRNRGGQLDVFRKPHFKRQFKKEKCVNKIQHTTFVCSEHLMYDYSMRKCMLSSCRSSLWNSWRWHLVCRHTRTGLKYTLSIYLMLYILLQSFMMHTFNYANHCTQSLLVCSSYMFRLLLPAIFRESTSNGSHSSTLLLCEPFDVDSLKMAGSNRRGTHEKRLCSTWQNKKCVLYPRYVVHLSVRFS